MTIHAPVTAAVTLAVTLQSPPCCEYTLTSVLMNPANEFRQPGRKMRLRSQTGLSLCVNHRYSMPSAPRMEDVDAMTRRGMCLVDDRMWEAVLEVRAGEVGERVCREVNVPGNMTKPARRIQVKNEARIL